VNKAIARSRFYEFEAGFGEEPFDMVLDWIVRILLARHL
jgi:hypothetical protein